MGGWKRALFWGGWFFAFMVFVIVMWGLFYVQADVDVQGAKDLGNWSPVGDKLSFIIGVPATIVLGAAAVYLGRQATILSERQLVSSDVQAKAAIGSLALEAGRGILMPLANTQKSVGALIRSMDDLMVQVRDAVSKSSPPNNEEQADFRKRAHGTARPICADHLGAFKLSLNAVMDSVADWDRSQSARVWQKYLEYEATSQPASQPERARHLYPSAKALFLSQPDVPYSRMLSGKIPDREKLASRTTVSELGDYSRHGLSVFISFLRRKVALVGADDLAGALLETFGDEWWESAMNGSQEDPETGERLSESPATEIEILDVIGLASGIVCYSEEKEDPDRLGWNVERGDWALNMMGAFLLDVMRVCGNANLIGDCCTEIVKDLAPELSEGNVQGCVKAMLRTYPVNQNMYWTNYWKKPGTAQVERFLAYVPGKEMVDRDAEDAAEEAERVSRPNSAPRPGEGLAAYARRIRGQEDLI